MFFEQSFILYYDSGEVEYTDNLFEVINRMGGVDSFHAAMKFNLGEFNKRNGKLYNISTGFFLCNTKGLMISPDLLYNEYQIAWDEFWKNKRKAIDDKFKHHRSWRFKHSQVRYKHPHTQQERRMACAVQKDEGEPPIRGKRKMRSIPSLWDDKKTRQSTGWKTSTKRKHQYKGS